MSYYLNLKSGRRVPCAVETLRRLLESGKIRKSTSVESEFGDVLTVSDVLSGELKGRDALVEEAQEPDEVSIFNLRGVLIGVLILLVIPLGISLFSAGSASDKVEVEAREMIRHFPGYGSYSDYYKKLLVRCHADAFDASYEMGFRRWKQTEFDASKYGAMLIKGMAEQAQRDGRSEVAVLLGGKR